MILRLGFAGLRGRLPGAVLAAILVMVASATAALAWHTSVVGGAPWERTFAATNGAHVLVHGDSLAVEGAAGLPGVVQSSGPVPRVFTSLLRGEQYGLQVAGIGASPSTVERPLVTDGRWIRSDDEVVLERSFAQVLGIEPGAVLTVKTTTGTTHVAVTGLAVLAAGDRYPSTQPGIAFGTPALVARIQPDRRAWLYSEALRLADPGQASTVARQAAALFPNRDGFVETWLDRRTHAADRNRVTAIVLTTFTVIELIAIGLILAAIVASRVLARQRELGLLKAVGFTPRQVALVFLVEQLVVGLAGAVAGVFVGAALTPVIVRRSAELVGSVPVEVDLTRLVVIVAAVIALVALVTIVPSMRGGRLTVAQMLRAAQGGSSISRLSRRVRLGRGGPLSLGLKQAGARPGRAAATAVALALTVSALVAGLAMESTLSHEDRVEAASNRTATFPPDPAGLAPSRLDPVIAGDTTREQIRPIVHGLNALVLAIALGGVFAAALLAVRERSRELGVLKAIGLTPKQIGASVLWAHGLLSVAATVVGLPLGLALFVGVYWLANGSTELVRLPPLWQLALVPLVAAAVMLAVTAYPARRAARLRVVDALRYE